MLFFSERGLLEPLRFLHARHEDLATEYPYGSRSLIPCQGVVVASPSYLPFTCCGADLSGFLNTRLLKWGYLPIDKRPHIDMYFSLKANLLTARKSQAHLLEWLETPEQKLTVGASLWNDILHNFAPAMKTMIQRCESDAKGLEQLYRKTRHILREIKR